MILLTAQPIAPNPAMPGSLDQLNVGPGMRSMEALTSLRRLWPPPAPILLPMSDPRNVAHDKKVHQEKKHHGEDLAKGAAETVQPGKKPEMQHPHAHEDPATERAEAAAEEAEEIKEAVEAHREKVDVHNNS
jgi:hypothetical protein